MKFKELMRSYCKKAEWSIESLDEDVLQLEFETATGNTLQAFVIKYDKYVEFSVPSIISFEHFEDIPHNISTALMRRNSDSEMVVWAIEDIQGCLLYTSDAADE